jgi:hypothetical protein
MRGLLLSGGSVLPADPRELDDVRDIIDAGWTVGPNGALFLAACWGDGWSRDVDAAAVGQVEYEVNDVHISLRDLAEDMESYLPKAAERGLAFARYMLHKALALPDSNRLHAAVSISVDKEDEDFLIQGAVVRFYSDRGRHPDWYDDLERFNSEAIAVLDFDDGLDYGA